MGLKDYGYSEDRKGVLHFWVEYEPCWDCGSTRHPKLIHYGSIPTPVDEDMEEFEEEEIYLCRRCFMTWIGSQTARCDICGRFMHWEDYICREEPSWPTSGPELTCGHRMCLERPQNPVAGFRGQEATRVAAGPGDAATTV